MSKSDVSATLPDDVAEVLQSLRMEGRRVVVDGIRELSVIDPENQSVLIVEPVLTMVSLAGRTQDGRLVTVKVSLPDQTAEIIRYDDGRIGYRFTIDAKNVKL